MVNDDGVASCVDAADGDVVWKKRIGGNFAASPIYAGRPRSTSSTRTAKPPSSNPAANIKLLATNTLDDGFMASPAVADGGLFLRTKSHLYRIEEATN